MVGEQSGGVTAHTIAIDLATQRLLTNDGLSEIEPGIDHGIIVRRLRKNAPEGSSSNQQPCYRRPLFVQIKQFLSEEKHKTILAYCREQETAFVAAQVTGGPDGYRRAMTIKDDTFIQSYVLPEVSRVAPDAATVLYIREDLIFDPGSFECRMTAHQDRGFFLVHSDNGSPGTAKRCLSFVYYFRARKSSFYGGELRIYRSPFERRSTFFGDDYALVYPEDNSIVFFQSSVAHEVLPTYVPSKLFQDSRFTVNGWIQSV